MFNTTKQGSQQARDLDLRPAPISAKVKVGQYGDINISFVHRLEKFYKIYQQI